jgi:tetratricopeptide (TPR) repeat protein
VKNRRLLASLTCVLSLLLLAPATHSSSQALAPARFPPLSPEATGDLLMARGHYLEALNVYSQAPVNAELWNKMGVAWDHLSGLDHAKQDYERALALRPDYPDALNNLGSAWFELKNYRKALQCYERAFALNPHSAIIAANLGTAYFAIGKFQEGEQAYHTAWELDPAALDFDAPHLDDGPTSKRARAHRDFCLAEIFAAQQLNARAIDHLRRAFYEGFHNWKRLMHDPAFAQLRQTPEFARLMIGPGPGPGPSPSSRPGSGRGPA